MRTITNNAVNAFMNARSFNSNNTSVEVLDHASYLKLHGNIIAVRYSDGKLSISNCGWFSNTTKERLNALPNVRIQQKQGVWYLNGNVWDGNLINIV